MNWNTFIVRDKTNPNFADSVIQAIFTENHENCRKLRRFSSFFMLRAVGVFNWFSLAGRL
jgi:hypothetical protein